MPDTAPERAPDPRRRILRSPYAWIAAIYAATWLALPAGHWINDNGLKLIQTAALRDSSLGDFSLAWPGEALDPEHRFRPVPPPLGIVREGRLYASYPPAFALLAAGPWALFGRAGLALWPLVGALALLPAAAGLARRLHGDGDAGRAATAAVWLAGLGTPLWFYAATFWEHTLAACCATWCLLGVLRLRERPDARRAIAVGVLAAAGAWLRTDAYLLAAIAVGLCLVRRGAGARVRALVLLSLVCGLVPLWVFQGLTLGHPLGLHVQSQQWGALTWDEWLAARGEVAQLLLLNCHPRSWIAAAVGGVFWAGLASRPRLTAARGALLAGGAALAAIAAAGIVAWGVFGHERPMVALVHANGLFAAAPFALFSFLRLAEEGPGPRAARTTLLVAFGLLAFLDAGLAPRVNATGLHWGCRFLLTTYPILAALAAPVLVHAWSRWSRLRPLLVAGLAATLALQASGIALLAARTSFDERVNRTVAAARPAAIVTDVWFLPATLTATFHRQPILLATGPAGVVEALRTLSRHGIGDALVITSEPAGRGLGEDPGVLSDGWPGLVSLRLRRVPTSPRDPDGAGGGS